MTETTETVLALPVLRAVKTIEDLEEAARLRGRTPPAFEISEPAEANAVRGLNVAGILASYMVLVGDTGEDLKTGITDLLGDLRHLTDALGSDWDEVLDRSAVDYDAEVAGEL